MKFIKVRVKAGLREESLRAHSNGSYEVSVRERPLQNEANRRVLVLIARHLNVPVKKVRIVRGHRGRSKILEIIN